MLADFGGNDLAGLNNRYIVIYIFLVYSGQKIQEKLSAGRDKIGNSRFWHIFC